MKSGIHQYLFLTLIGSLALTAYSAYGGARPDGSLLFLEARGSRDLSAWGQWTESFVRSPSAPTLAIFQRWSLSEIIDTQTDRASHFPMEQSENELFRAMATFLPSLPENTLVITDSCAGNFSKTHAEIKNGWSFTSLQENLKNPNFSFILTFLPWKLELAVDRPTEIVCGEELPLLERQRAIWQSLRADIGTLSRLEPASPIRASTQAHFARELAIFDETLSDRARSLVKFMSKFSNRNLVLVSHHALNRNLVRQLRLADINYSIFETRHFQPIAADSSTVLHGFLQSLRAP